MYWWWDTYIEPLDLWHHFAALTHFLAEIDPATLTPTAVEVATESAETVMADARLLQGENQALLWVRSRAYTGAAVDAADNDAVRAALCNRQTLGEFIYTPPAIHSHQVRLANMPTGRYQLHWYDPQTGNWGEIQTVEARNGILVVELPTFRQDIAARIQPLP